MPQGGTSLMAELRQRPVSHIGDWIFETNEILEITFVSDRFEETTGMSQKHIVGWTLPSLVLSDPSAGRGEGRTFNLEDKKPFGNVLCSLKNPEDGSIYHFSVAGKPFFSPNGVFRGYRGAAHNATTEIQDRVIDEDTAPNDTSTETLLGDMSKSGDALIAYDANGVLVFCNDPYRNCYPGIASLLHPGTPLQDVLRASAKLSGMADDPATLDDWIEKRMAERLSPSGEVEEHYINSRWWQIHEYIALDGTIINRRRDITQEKAKQLKMPGVHVDAMDSSALASGAQYILSEVVDALEEGFALYDSSRHLIVANARYGRMLGLDDTLLIPGTLFSAIMLAVSEEALPDADDQTRREWREPFLDTAAAFTPEPVVMKDGRRLVMGLRKTDGGLLAHTLIDAPVS